MRDSAFGIVVQLRWVEGAVLLVHLYLLQFEKMMLSRVLAGLQEVRLIFFLESLFCSKVSLWYGWLSKPKSLCWQQAGETG